MKLADLLRERGDLDELRARADAGDLSAATGLAGLLEERGDLDELRARADAGDAQRRYKAGQRWPSSRASWTGCAPGLLPTTRTPP